MMRLIIQALTSLLLLSHGIEIQAFSQFYILNHVINSNTNLYSSHSTIEVCGFKDCKQRGGAAKLEKLFHSVIAEKGLEDRVVVQSCDCQGECGYGPNVVKNGQIMNNINDREAVLKVLDLELPQQD